jgi:hypothetical protein
LRVPLPLAWTLIAGTFFTAGLLRRFHELTPRAPFAPAAVGSLLFAAILFLLLVAAREWRLGGSPGPGVRFGSLAPLLLMLLIEKWVSVSLYNPIFGLFAPAAAAEPLQDAMFRAFAGAGLLATALLVAQLSRPAGRRTWATCRPTTLLRGLGVAAAVVGLTYLLLGGLAVGLGAGASFGRSPLDTLGAWVVGGQAARSFAEEVYYRGLLLWEMERLAPRLGAKSPAARRWTALIPVALLFGMEHVTIGAAAGVTLRQGIFTVALGVLLGMIVLTTRNVGLAWGLHAWINVLMLGPAPRLLDAQGHALLPSGTYVGVALALAFVAVWWLSRRNAG